MTHIRCRSLAGKRSCFDILRVLIASAILAQATPSIATKQNSTAPSRRHELIASYAGHTFFDHFTTYTGPDPTNGFVNYTDMAFAAQQELIGLIAHEETNTTSAYIGVDHTSLAPNGRNSVRLISKQKFDVGSMVVIDLNHIPSQYGLWPAIWMLGSEGEWPASGESDILEYVHRSDYNVMTLHTAPGCTIINSSAAQGTLSTTNCNAGNAALGCSVDAFDQNRLRSLNKTMATAGAAFNAQGGGVYIHDWTKDGIKVWLFAHDDLPADLIAGKPQPTLWKQRPLAHFCGAGCDFSQAFRSMQLIINIDFGGDWAGKVWESSGSANATGCATANEYIANHPKAFKKAYFDIASIKFFSNRGQNPVTTSGRQQNSLMARAIKCRAAARYPLAARSAMPVQAQTSDTSSSRVPSWLFASGMYVVLAFCM